MTRWLLALALLAGLGAVTLAQDPPAMVAQSPGTEALTRPSLSTEEKQALVIASQAVEIAELRLVLARVEYGRLLQAAQRDGYELTPTLEYVPVQKDSDARQ